VFNIKERGLNIQKYLDIFCYFCIDLIFYSMVNSLFFRNFFRRDTTMRALKVALVVAPVLIIINHFDSIVHKDFPLAFYIKSFLTFLVPYTVSAYSSAKAYSEDEIRRT